MGFQLPGFFKRAVFSGFEFRFFSSANGNNLRDEEQGGKKDSRSPSKKIRLPSL